jgi:hypothetical protein
MHEMDGLRFNRYHELGQVCPFGVPSSFLRCTQPHSALVHDVALVMLIRLCFGAAQYAFGPRTGLWVVVPFQVIVMVGESRTPLMMLMLPQGLEAVPVCAVSVGIGVDMPWGWVAVQGLGLCTWSRAAALIQHQPTAWPHPVQE